MNDSDSPILRVLCVDDNREAADTLGIMLELIGFDTRVCYDGFEALRVAETFHPDACILDLTLPGMDGDELGRQLRARDWGHSLPLVAITGHDGEEARRRTAGAGFDLHLTKPVDPDRLANVLADIVILRGMTATPSGVVKVGGRRSTDPPADPQN